MRRALTIAVFAVSGWAVCAAAIGLGFSLTTERGALIVHAFVAPIALAWLELGLLHALCFTRPLTTAAIFVVIVVTLDVFVVATLMQRGFAMFASVLATWLPLASSSTAPIELAQRENRAHGNSMNVKSGDIVVIYYPI